MQDYPDVDAYLADCDRWPHEIAAIRPILLATGLDETIRWGKPCYRTDDDNVVLLQEFVDHLALMFFRGVLLDDPNGVLRDQGPNSHAAKRMVFTSVDEVDALADVITRYVHEAIEHTRAGTELPPRPDRDLAPELAERLAGDDRLAAAFGALTPGRRREYDLFISGAKQAATRERRIDGVVEKILAGRGLRDR